MINRNTSPPARLQVLEPATVIRGVSPEPPVYYQHKEQLKDESVQYRQQPSNNMFGPPSISFGLTGSNFKGNNTITIPTAYGNDFYEGELNQHGQFHGDGKYFYGKTKHEYHGQFENGRPHGRGVLYKNIGTNPHKPNSTNLFVVYEGQWKNGMRNGEGKYYYNSQNHYYQGPWLNDQRHGPVGTYVSPIGKYVGRWEQGRMEGGRGQFYINRTNTKYEGFFHNNEFAHGSIEYPNGDRYTGEVKNGRRDDNNQGRYSYSRLKEDPDQIRYTGGWKADLKDDKSGQAFVTFLNGESLKGTFIDNQFQYSSECNYQWTDGETFKGWIQKLPNGTINLKGVIKRPNGQEYEV